MKKITDAIKAFLGWFKKTVISKEWLFIFPLCAFGFIALAGRSILAIIALGIWVVTVVYNTNEE